MKKRQRLPIEQLRAAGKAAQEMLVKKGLAAPDSALEKIRQMKDAPMLPGMPEYLPHVDTLHLAQRIMYDLLVMWKAECLKTPTYYIKVGRSKRKMTEGRIDNVTEFFKFVVKEMRAIEKLLKKEMDAMPPLLTKLEAVPVMSDILRPLGKYENTRAMLRFLVDSFAVAVVLKQKHSTAEYADWFLGWSEQLENLWQKPKKTESV